MKWAALTAVASLLLGCGAVDSGTLGSRAEELYYASASGPEDDAVVKLRAIKNDGDTLWCTATLIAPNLVLTAMHCVAMVSDNANCTSAGELPKGSVDGLFGDAFVPSNITIHVGAGTDEPVGAVGEKIFTTGAISVCKDDLAAVALDRELTNVPLAAVRLGAGNQRGESIRIVGFGGAEDGSTGVRKTRDDLKIQLLGASEFADSSDPIPPNTFATIGASVCNGDSGGPIFTTSNAVTGVVSHGASCASTTARRIFTQVAPYQDLLLTPAFAYVGHDPILEAADSGDAGAVTGSGGAAGDGFDGGVAAGPEIGGTNNAGTAGRAATGTGHSPPGKGGCACSSTATSRRGLSHALSIALALGAACWVRRRSKSNRPRLPPGRSGLL